MRRIGWTAALAVLAMVPGAGRAEAHAVPALLGDALRVAGGLYEVPLRTGPPLLTHGADGPQEPGGDALGTGRRPPLCTGDAHQVILYGRPVTAPDESAAAREPIEAAVFNMNAELDRAAMESGGLHADYR